MKRDVKMKANIIHLKTTETKMSGTVSTALKWIEMANKERYRKCKNNNSNNINTSGSSSSNNRKKRRENMRQPILSVKNKKQTPIKMHINTNNDSTVEQYKWMDGW